MYVLINNIIIRTCALYQIQITASLSDEDTVYLIDSVVRGLHISKRVRFPTACKGLELTRAFRRRFSSFVGQLAIQGTLESGASACAIFVTREHKSTNLTRVTSVCAK